MGSLKIYNCTFTTSAKVTMLEHSAEIPANSAQRAAEMWARELQEAGLDLSGVVTATGHSEQGAAEVLSDDDQDVDEFLHGIGDVARTRVGKYQLIVIPNVVRDDRNGEETKSWKWELGELESDGKNDDIANGLSWNSAEEARLIGLAIIYTLMMHARVAA